MYYLMHAYFTVCFDQTIIGVVLSETEIIESINNYVQIIEEAEQPNEQQQILIFILEGVKFFYSLCTYLLETAL